MKDNANPIIYSISDEKKRDDGDHVATEVLKRLSQEASIADGGHDSLYHLDPSKLLTPLERSIQNALSDINRHHIDNGGSRGGSDDPLNIISMAGIKVGNANGNANAMQSDRNRSIYYFRPASCNPDTNDVTKKDNNIDGRSKTKSKAIRRKRDVITASEVFDIIRNIQDPEHPLTLQQLNVVNRDHVEVYDALASDNLDNSNNNDNSSNNKENPNHKYSHSTINVKFTPTIPHCSMATLIGLCIRVKLLRSVPRRFKVTVKINPGTHASEMAVNRQLNDKERVIAALENTHLLGVVNKCIANGMNSDDNSG